MTCPLKRKRFMSSAIRSAVETILGRVLDVLKTSGVLVLSAAMAGAQTSAPVQFAMPHSSNPFSAYSGSYVPPPVLTDPPPLDKFVKDGKPSLSLNHALDLALENNLDLAMARYDLP